MGFAFIILCLNLFFENYYKFSWQNKNLFLPLQRLHYSLKLRAAKMNCRCILLEKRLSYALSLAVLNLANSNSMSRSKAAIDAYQGVY